MIKIEFASRSACARQRASLRFPSFSPREVSVTESTDSDAAGYLASHVAGWPALALIFISPSE